MGISNCLGGVYGDVCETVILLNDPLRAKFVSENYLREVNCYSVIRGMFGYTGLYNGKKVSVQSIGIWIPTTCIYLYDLIHDHKVKILILLGYATALSKEPEVGDVIIATSASGNNNINNMEFPGLTFAPTPTYELCERAVNSLSAREVKYFLSPVLTTDIPLEDESLINKWRSLGVIAWDTETAGLYTYGAKFSVSTVSMLTVCSNLATGKAASLDQQRSGFTKVLEAALNMAGEGK